MSLRQRTPTAIALLGILFVVIQYAPNWIFFLIGQAYIVAVLLEFYNLADRKRLLPQRALGIGLAILVSLTFYFRSIPLEAAQILWQR